MVAREGRTDDEWDACDVGRSNRRAGRLDESGPDTSLQDFGQVSDAPSGSNFVDVAAGGNHSCAMTDDGDVRCWGYDEYGQVSSAP